MILFQVFNREGRPVMHTNYVSCIYDLDDLKSMEGAGYTFKLQDKKMSANAVDKIVKSGTLKDIIDSTKKEEKPEEINIISRTIISTVREDKEDADKVKLTAETSVSKSVQGPPPGMVVNSRTVRCIETGQYFKTQAVAAQKYGIDPAYVSDSVKTGKSYKGYTFEKVLK